MSPSLEPPPTLCTLPAEMLHNICEHLDRSTALSLLLTCKQLEAYSMKHILRFVDLTAEIPGPNMDTDFEVWDKDAYYARLVADVREGCRAILEAEPSRKLLSLTAPVRPECTDIITELLSQNSSTISTLNMLISDSITRVSPAFADSFASDILRVLELNPFLSFPNLTHIRLECMAAQSLEFIILLCSLASNLLFLDCDIHQDEIPPFALPHVLDRDSVISKLCIAYTSRGERWAPHPNRSRYLDQYHSASSISTIIRHNPLLRQLFLKHSDQDGVQTPDLIAHELAQLQHLQELYWGFGFVWSIARLPEWESETASFPALRGLILEECCWRIPSAAESPEHIFPSLEVVLIHSLQSWGWGHLPATIEPQSFLWLRARPRLHLIHIQSDLEFEEGPDVFDNLHKLTRENVNCTVSSILNTRNTGELIHGRILVVDLDYTRDYGGQPTVTRLHRAFYSPRDLLPAYGRDCDYVQVTEPVWLDQIDYDGVAVPPEVVARMKEVEESEMGEKGNWDRRGVEVGDASWKVLTDWREAQKVSII